MRSLDSVSGGSAADFGCAKPHYWLPKILTAIFTLPRCLSRNPGELAVFNRMPKPIAITLWSMIAACLFAFGMAVLVSHHV
jgi:hypothetical protein